MIFVLEGKRTLGEDSRKILGYVVAENIDEAAAKIGLNIFCRGLETYAAAHPESGSDRDVFYLNAAQEITSLAGINLK